MLSDPQLTSWGTFLSGLGTFMLASLGVFLLFYDVRLRRRQLHDSLSRSYSTLNLTLRVSVYPRVATDSAPGEWILEARVEVKNAGSEILAIPAAYIQARALPKSNEYLGPPLSEKDFDGLQPIGRLSQPMNAAHFPEAIWHIGPDEVDNVVRWDVLPDEFIQQHPIIVVKASVFCLPNQAIGAAYSDDRKASSDRRQWLELMERDDGARHKKVAFIHAHESSDGIHEGEWVLLESNSDEVDIVASRHFRRVLAKLCHTGRQQIVVFNALGGSGPANSPGHTLSAEERGL